MKELNLSELSEVTGGACVCYSGKMASGGIIRQTDAAGAQMADGCNMYCCSAYPGPAAQSYKVKAHIDNC